MRALQQNRNKLGGSSRKPESSKGSTQLIFIGVGLIVLALLMFGAMFLFGKGGDSSSKSESTSGGESTAESSSQGTTQTKASEGSSSQAQTQEAVTTSAQEQDSSQSAKPEADAQMQVHFIDVGQGDCTLITCGGEAMLVDSGERDDGDTVINYIKKLGVKSFKYIIVTHPHTDHMGEMPDILKAFKTQYFIMPKVPDSMVPTIMRYEKMLKQVKAQGLSVTWSSDASYKLGSAEVRTFTPKQLQEDLNNYSTLVKVTCAGRSVLITGDCEAAEEKDIMSQKFDLKSDILKIAHHGSFAASSYEFLETVVPEYAVISCGKDNDYGHPHDSAMKRIRKKVKNIYITKDNGTVVFDCSASGIKVKAQR